MNPINHVAIIMDGNGRWGILKKNSRKAGHEAGLQTIEKIIKTSVEQNIKYLTLYAFSTENWKRPKSEINFLFGLLEKFLNSKINLFIRNRIKLKVIGDKKVFSNRIKNLLYSSEKKTKLNFKLQINLALNYGSKDEIIQSVKNMIKKKQIINKENLNNNLYTKNIPDPEILIRTGKTNRLSNFLLWQLAYTEIYFFKKLWPDFTQKDYLKILNNFRKLKRNFGSI